MRDIRTLFGLFFQVACKSAVYETNALKVKLIMSILN